MENTDTVLRDLAFTLVPLFLIIAAIIGAVRMSRRKSDRKIQKLEKRITNLEEKGDR